MGEPRPCVFNKRKSMINLAAGQCVACRGGELTVADDEIITFLPQMPEWAEVKMGKQPSIGGHIRSEVFIKMTFLWL